MSLRRAGHLADAGVAMISTIGLVDTCWMRVLATWTLTAVDIHGRLRQNVPCRQDNRLFTLRSGWGR